MKNPKTYTYLVTTRRRYQIIAEDAEEAKSKLYEEHEDEIIPSGDIELVSFEAK